MVLFVVLVILIDEIFGVFNFVLIVDFIVFKLKFYSGLGKLICNCVKVLLIVRLRLLVKVLSVFLYLNIVNVSKIVYIVNIICIIEVILIFLNMWFLLN